MASVRAERHGAWNDRRDREVPTPHIAALSKAKPMEGENEMSWNKHDYAGETNAAAYREYEDELEQLRLERKEREENEIRACEAADRENAVWLAVEGWKQAVTAIAEGRAA